MSSVFWNDSWFEDAVAFAQMFGVKRSEWFEAMLPAMKGARGPVREFLDSFVRETIGELFPTREACFEFYNTDENFQRLLSGEIGDNLMYKYRAIASFRIWPHICATAMEATRHLLTECGATSRIPDFDTFWDDFCSYMRAKHADGTSEEDILNPVRVKMTYDVAQWVADGMPMETDTYKLAEPEVFEFALSDEGAHQLGAALKVWTPTLKGLTKMVTRVRMAWQVRQAHRTAAEQFFTVPAAAADPVGSGLLPDTW